MDRKVLIEIRKEHDKMFGLARRDNNSQRGVVYYTSFVEDELDGHYPVYMQNMDDGGFEELKSIKHSLEEALDRAYELIMEEAKEMAERIKKEYPYPSTELIDKTNYTPLQVSHSN